MGILEELCEVVTVGGVFKVITTICRRNGVEGWEGPWEGRTFISRRRWKKRSQQQSEMLFLRQISARPYQWKKGFFSPHLLFSGLVVAFAHHTPSVLPSSADAMEANRRVVLQTQSLPAGTRGFSPCLTAREMLLNCFFCLGTEMT